MEYAALGQDFHTRGRRIEEQVALMRQLWTQPLVTFNGKWHTLPDVGLKPLPVQRPIPIWFGGSVEAALKRLARLADGWLLTYRSLDQARPMLEKLDQFLAEAGRSRDSFGLEPRLAYGDGNPESWAKEIEAWKAFRPTHLSFNTMGKGFDTPEAHMKAVREFAKAAFG